MCSLYKCFISSDSLRAPQGLFVAAVFVMLLGRQSGDRQGRRHESASVQQGVVLEQFMSHPRLVDSLAVGYQETIDSILTQLEERLQICVFENCMRMLAVAQTSTSCVGARQRSLVGH